MGTKMNKESYQKLIDEDLEWLNKQPRTLERIHIADIVKESIDFYYPKQADNLPISSVVVSLICDHPKDEREDYHDCSVVCNKCGCVIEQYGKEINPPSPL